MCKLRQRYFPYPVPFLLGERRMSGCDGMRHGGGFTLIEVLVATSILGIAIAVILQLFSANLRAISVSGDYVSATARAEASMRDILNNGEITEKAFSETTVDGYRIDVSMEEALKDRTENLPVKLMEIDLTIHWFKGPKEKSLTLRTMKVLKREV